MKPIRNSILFFAAALFLNGCVYSLQDACEKLQSERMSPPPTREEKLAGSWGGCFRYAFMDKKSDGTWEFAPDKVKLVDVQKVVQQIQKDLNEVLDWNKESNVRILKYFGLRPHLEKEERKYGIREYRLKTAIAYETFRQFMGVAPLNHDDEYLRRGGYKLRFLYPLFDLESEFKFVSPDLDRAWAEKELVYIGSMVWFSREEYAFKEQDPTFSNDPNKFVWRKRIRGVEWRADKKIRSDTQPFDNTINYVEGTRVELVVDSEGRATGITRELKPAVRIFTSLHGDNLDVLVADVDREGEKGFGLPDLVEKIFGVRDVNDLQMLTPVMVGKIFVEKPAKKRVEPKPLPEMIAEIVRMGESTVDPWESAPTSQGWTVPIQYKSEKSDNYRIGIKLKQRKPIETDNLRQIEFVIKKWYAPANEWQVGKGEVVEYYKPKLDFANRNILETRIDLQNRKRVSISRDGLSDMTVYVASGDNPLVGEKPSAIVFTDGEKRWMIRDKDGDGIFEGRKEIAKGSENEGESSGPPVPSGGYDE